MFDNSYSTMSQSTNPKTVERFTNPKVDTIKNIRYRIVDLQNEAFQQMRWANNVGNHRMLKKDTNIMFIFNMQQFTTE